IPLIVAGALLSKFVKSVLYASFGVIGTAFIVGGIVMLIVERFRPQPDVVDAERMSIGRAFAVGLGQTLALIPGVSRSGGTIVASVRRHGFAPFGWYRIVLGAVLLAVTCWRP